MITIADRVRLWMDSHPAHASFAADGLINASALARQLKPELEKEANETVSLEAVTLALNRFTKNAKAPKEVKLETYVSEVSVQSGLSIISIAKTSLNPDGFSKAIAILHKTNEYTLYSHSTQHTWLVGKQAVVEELTAHFSHTFLAHDLVAIAVKFKAAKTLSIYAYILQKLAFQGIDLIEFISTQDEMTFIVDKAHTNKVMGCLI